MRARTLIAFPLFFVVGEFLFLSSAPQVYAETVTLYSQPDNSGEMISQQPMFLNTWISSASLGNLFLGKDRLFITFTMKDPNANTTYHSPFGGVALGTCSTCQDLQKYYFTDADRAILSDGAFHTFTFQTGTTTLGTADGETPIYIKFFGLSQYYQGTHIKSNAAGTIPTLTIEAASLPILPSVPQVPAGSITVYEQSDKTGVMTNPQVSSQNSYIDSESLGNLPLGKSKLYLTFTMKDPHTSGAYTLPQGVCIEPAGTRACGTRLQTYYFTKEDRAMLADGAFHTFMIETGTTTNTYADGTRPVAIGFFGLMQYQYGTKVKSNAETTIPFLKIHMPPPAPPPDPCAAPGACASSVLFLPGIEASRLYHPDYAGGTSKLWEPGGDADVKDLYMNPDGTSVRNDIYTKDVVDEAYGTLNIYKSFLADLDAWKNDAHIINDYRAVPYDWRVSLDDILNYGNRLSDDRLYYSGVHSATSTPYIIQELRRLASASKTGKVTIVAHSNGGLVAKALIKRLEDTHDPLLDKIDSLIMVAVPQVGTPQAVGALLHGYGQSIPFELFHPFLSPAVAREFAHNDPMAHHLLPSDAYFAGSGSGVETPVVTFRDGAATRTFIDRYGDTIDSAVELRDFLLGVEGRTSPAMDDLVNPSVLLLNLVAYGEGVHASLDAWTPPASTTVHEIAGWGEDTVSGIIYDTDRKCVARLLWSCTKYEDMLHYTPDLVIDGDGTVVAPSALAMSTSTENVKRWWVDLGDYNDPIIGINRDHKDILEVPELRTFIKDNLLTKSTTTLPLFLSDSTPLPRAKAKHLRFFLHSPLALSATDAIGNEISAATSTIPGARYRRFGDVQYISVPADAAPTLRLSGVAAGSFTLEAQEVLSDTIIATTTFLGIPNATTTTAHMSFPDGTIAHASPLTVDADGDGDIDLTLQPRVGETVVPDTTPPELIVTFATSTNALAFIGTDNMGSTTIATSTTYPALKKKEKEPRGIATTTVIARDEAGNTTTLVYTEKPPSPKGRDTIILREIAYNGATTTIVSTALSYKWRIGKNGQYKLFASHLQTFATSTESHYRPKKNITAIMTKPRNLDDDDDDDDVDTRPIKERLPGMIIPRMVTENGKLDIKY